MKLRRLLKSPVLLAALALAFALLATALLSPWMRAGTHPLVARCQTLHQGTTLYAELPDGWKAPLVPVDKDTFITELPPRKSYEGIALSAEGGAALYGSAEIKWLDRQQFEDTYITGTDLTVGIAPGAKFPLTGCFAPKCYFWQALLPLLPLFLLLFFGVAALFQKTSAEKAAGAGNPGFRLWQWGILLALAAGEILLVATSNPLFWSADSIGYTGKALSLYQHGVYSTGGIYQEILRSPGAPLIEALAWRIFGFSFASVALLQAILYAGACLLALHAVAKALSRNAALVAAPFLFFAPAAIFGNRLMASEGPFATFALFTAGAFLLAESSTGRKRLLWILAAGAFAGYAALIRPNGVVLAAFPLFSLARGAALAIREKNAAPIRAVLPLAAAAALCLGSLAAWSARNYVFIGWFAPTDIGGLSMAESCFKSGILDLSAACDDEALYAEVVKARYDSHYNFEAWALSHLYQKRLEALGPIDASADRIVDGRLASFAARSRAATPFAARAAGLCRTFRWGLFQDKDANYQPYGLQDFRFVTYPQGEWDYTNSVITGWIHRDLGFAQTPPYAAQRAFNSLMPLHARLYTIAAALGVLLLALSLWRGYTAGLVLLLPYYGNILLNAALGVIVARYVTVLEPLLVLGIAAALREALRDLRSRAAGCGKTV
jgi:hypothetical protein